MPEPNTQTNLIGCDFDAATAKAVAGKDIIALVTDSTGATPLCIAGQTGLNFDVSAETSDVATKDGGGWSIKFYGTKSWSAAVDGLFAIDDEAADAIAAALKNDQHLCLKVCQRIVTAANISYKPIRMGVAVVSAYNVEAPNDDNATYSMSFEGSGEPWLIETATQQEIDDATLVIPVAAANTNGAEG